MLQSPQGARIVAEREDDFMENPRVTVPARGANCSMLDSGAISDDG